MPRSREALALTDGYRSRLLDLRESAAQLVTRAWLALSPSDLDASYEEWLATAVGIVEATKVQGVTLTDAYLASFVAAELDREPEPQGVDPEAYLETEDGRPLAAALLPPLFTVKAALKQRRPDAFQLGHARATRIVAEEALGAPRRALGDLMEADPLVAGWKRVTSLQPCGACLAEATGDVEDPSTPFRRHSHCRCTREPVVKGAPDRFPRPTGQQIFDSLSPEGQAALFRGRGGAEKAELIRTGQVPLAALSKRQAQAVGPDQFTEAPMRDLRSMTNG